MKAKNETIICNAIICPDGTYLRSYNVHDYKSHTDKLTGELYVVDGGNEYLRRSVNIRKAHDMTVYLSDPFKAIREAFVWKSYGKNGEYLPNGKYIALQDMTNDHLCAILETQTHIKGTYVEDLMKQELAYRKEFSNE